ncbi:MAG: NTP pyrophosphohydrolase [Planctomycetaceae bacterium]|jgi:NTP pyrophosphatase (non-canonical NTP hydrolase)|nr:NTP pyrophosphohydrolase [Planctomycetaceae bacterium]|tara:strand:+ start:4273 stop:4647 length:375 start_codon:yes stop_codon:yes gene_type:complete
MNDASTTISELSQLIADFVEERDWNQFHSPKNISMSMAIEAAELMEHFQWISMQESREVNADAEKLEAVGEELADVLCYALALANQLDIDVADTIERKMQKNRLKYPAQDFQGRYGHKHQRDSE